jgi:hypothetical protein
MTTEYVQENPPDKCPVLMPRYLLKRPKMSFDQQNFYLSFQYFLVICVRHEIQFLRRPMFPVLPTFFVRPLLAARRALLDDLLQEQTRRHGSICPPGNDSSLEDKER